MGAKTSDSTFLLSRKNGPSVFSKTDAAAEIIKAPILATMKSKGNEKRRRRNAGRRF
jgi:hypothetical protein